MPCVMRSGVDYPIATKDGGCWVHYCKKPATHITETTGKFVKSDSSRAFFGRVYESHIYHLGYCSRHAQWAQSYHKFKLVGLIPRV